MSRNEGGPPRPGSNFINFEKLRQTPEYQTFLLQALKGKLRNMMLPGINKRLTASVNTPDDLENLGEEELEQMMDAMMASGAVTEEESDLLEEIGSIEDIEEVKEFSLVKNLGFDVDSYIHELEARYADYQGTMVEWREKILGIKQEPDA
jgi:hypothetical protein